MCDFGSNASLIASPINVTIVRITTIQITTDETIQSEPKLSVPSCRSCPQDGVGAGRPKPRKSSAVKLVMPLAMENGMKVTIVEILFGRMCLNKRKL